MAILFSRNLEQALGDGTSEGGNTYTDDIIQGFKNQSVEVRGLELRKNGPVHGQTVERFKSFAAFKSWLESIDETDYEKLADSYAITKPYMIRIDILSLAIAMDDVATVKKFAQILLQEKSTFSDDTHLIQACRRGNAEVVHALLDAGADPETVTESGCSLYHWLFMLGDGARSIANQLMNSERKPTNHLLNRPCSRPYVLHPQWPLELVGTPLAFAILSKSTEAVEVLLHLGALPFAPITGSKDQISNICWTPIHLAVKFHLVDILHLLLDHMSLSSPFLSPDGSVEISTFGLARSISHSTMLERLVMHGKDMIPALTRTLAELPSAVLSTASNDGLTPFMEAIDFSDFSVVKAMLQLAPELALKRFIDPEDPRLFTYPAIFAAQIAARRESSLPLDIVKLLLAYMPKNYLAKDSDGRTPLHLSVVGYSTSTTKWLLANHYSPNLPDNNGRTAVHQARSTASLDVLLDAGADINRADRSGLTCSHLAALQGFEDLVEGLIYRNVNLKRVSDIGSPLHCAILKQSWRIVCSLLMAEDVHGQPRVDINGMDANGDTAMHLAVKNSSSADIFRLLFSHGACANIHNKDGLAPLHLLVSSGNLESIKAFLLAEKVVRDSGNMAIMHGAFVPGTPSEKHISPIFKNRLSSGSWPVIDFDMSTSDGRTPSHIAATFASVEISNILENNGTSMITRDMDGNTEVHLAVLATDHEIAQRGGDRYEYLHGFRRHLSAENRQGIQPWDLAFRQKDFELMTFLLREGRAEACHYKTLLTHRSGRIILHDAVDANEWELVNVLLSQVNRCHPSPPEEGALSLLLEATGEDVGISSMNQVTEILTDWLEVFAQAVSSLTPIQEQIEALKPKHYSLKQIQNLCMVVNTAADYRALNAIGSRIMPLEAERHFSRPRFARRCGRIYTDVPDHLSPFRTEQFAANLEELKLEAFKRWEALLLSTLFPGISETHKDILRLFHRFDLGSLLRLAVVTSVILPERPIEQSESCCFTDNYRLIPELSEAVSNRDGTIVKQRFPIDPDVAIQCCSWTYELPPNYDQPEDI